MTAPQPAVRPQDGPNTNAVGIYLPAVTNGAPGGVEPLLARLTAVISRWAYSHGTHGPMAAAVRVLADREIADGLRAARVLTQLDTEHRWRVWADGTSRSCTCGTAACTVRDLLDQTTP